MNQQGWRNQASLANYPFASGSSRTSVEGASTLKTSDIVDAHLVARTADETGFYVSEMDVSEEAVSGTIMSESGTFGTFSVPGSYALGRTARVIDEGGIDRGVIVFGPEDPDAFGEMATGAVEFDTEALRFHDGVVFHPPVNRVATISINDVPVYGRVRLKAGTGIRLEVLEEDGKDVIVVHATGAQVEKDCGTGSPIKNFNSVPPNEYGTIFLRPAPYMTPETAESLRQLLRIRASDDNNGIIISLAELNR